MRLMDNKNNRYSQCFILILNENSLPPRGAALKTDPQIPILRPLSADELQRTKEKAQQMQDRFAVSRYGGTGARR
jgi:hypothetical protein